MKPAKTVLLFELCDEEENPDNPTWKDDGSLIDAWTLDKLVAILRPSCDAIGFPLVTQAAETLLQYKRVVIKSPGSKYTYRYTLKPNA